MKFSLFISTLLLAIFSGTVLARNPVVRIGAETYSSVELEEILEHNEKDPMIAVQKLMRKQAIESYGRSTNRNGFHRNSLYHEMFGCDYDEDRTRLSITGINSGKRNQARVRMQFFKRWSSQHADNTIPVVILDPDAFWKMVMNTQAYKIRKESGHEPSRDTWRYTWAELQVDPDMILARQKGLPMYRGEDFNREIHYRYPEYMHYATRGRDINELRGTFARNAINTIACEHYVHRMNIPFPKVIVDRAVQKYIDDEMMLTVVNCRGIEASSLRDIRQQLRERYEKENAQDIQNFRSIIENGTKNRADNSRAALSRRYAAREALFHHCFQKINEDQVYAWIQKNRFKNDYLSAKKAVADERMQKIIDNHKKLQEISICTDNLETTQ